MSVQKLLPLARKMGEENFLAYKQYMKAVKAGKSANLTMNLKNTTIIDTLSFTIKEGQNTDIDGFRNLLREIHKKYFPRAGSSDTIKKVEIMHNSLDYGDKITIIGTETSDKNGTIGKSAYAFYKIKEKLTVDISSRCEDFSMNFFGIFKLKNNDLNNIKSTTVTLPKGTRIDDSGDRVKFHMHALTTPEVPAFEAHASISKEKFEKIFGGELEEALPDLIKKSGFKIDF